VPELPGWQEEQQQQLVLHLQHWQGLPSQGVPEHLYLGPLTVLVLLRHLQ
jgi:hypothetical protein